MLVVPLKAVASQKVTVSLGGQTCQIEVYQKQTGLFMNLSVNNTLIIGGVICEYLNRIVRSLYLGFSGDLCFVDNLGETDPVYTGLGDRYSLIYISAEELPAGQG